MTIERGHIITGPLQLDIHSKTALEQNKQRKLPVHSILPWNLSLGTPCPVSTIEGPP